MTPSAVPNALRGLWPPRLRTRLTVFYALVIFLMGVVLLALSYTLADHYLLPALPPSPKELTGAEQQLLGLCKPAPTSGPLVAQCLHLLAKLGDGASARGDALAKLQWATAIALVGLAFLSVTLGWLVSGRALRPVRSLTEAARRASELRLGERLSLDGPDDELKQLAESFDTMLERLDAAFTSQKRFVANAAHELRTPLTLMRTAIDVTLAKPQRTPQQLEAMAADIRRSVERAEATVEALLTLATSELGPAKPEAVDLATVAEDALDAARAEIDRRRLTVDAEFESARAHGDPVLLERMVANLIENAVRHNSEGGWIGVRTVEHDGVAVFEVTNSGDALEPEQIPVLFEPFARAKQRLSSADGVGLGLSIASAIAHAHDAEIRATPRAGGGLAVSVSVPRSAVDDADSI